MKKNNFKLLTFCIIYFFVIESNAQVVSTYAGTGVASLLNGSISLATFDKPHGVYISPTGDIYIADQQNHSIRKISSTGVVSTFAGTGATGSANCDMDAKAVSFTLTVTGTRGEALAHNLLAPAADDRITVTRGTQRTVEALGKRTSYTYQLEALARWIREGIAVPTDAADAVVNMRMIDAVYEAAGMKPRPAFGSAGLPTGE